MYQTEDLFFEISLYSSDKQALDKCISTAVRNKNKITCAGYRSSAQDARAGIR